MVKWYEGGWSESHTLCHTHTHTPTLGHFGGHWRNFKHQCEGLWSECGLTCSTMASSLHAAPSTSVCHRAEYISQRLYINPSMSHCAGGTMALFMSTEAENSSSIIYSISKLARECGGWEGRAGFKKRTFRHRPHTWRHGCKAAICSFVVKCAANHTGVWINAGIRASLPLWVGALQSSRLKMSTLVVCIEWNCANTKWVSNRVLQYQILHI